MVLWAHNEHISKSNKTMGAYLSERYGANYLAIAQTCFSGHYTANIMGDQVYSTNPIAPPLPGSFESICHSTGMPIFALDVRTANPGSEASAWLKKPILMRSIGGAVQNNQQFETRVSEEFDLVLYFENTSATDCFDVKQKKQ